MDFNQRIKIFKRHIARVSFFVFNWIFQHLPYGIVKGLSHALITLGFQFTVKQKRLARESLSIAFGGEKSPDEINRIIRGCFNNFGEGMIEMLYCLSHPDMARRKVSFLGKEYLDEALSKGKGVIAVTAHFGNFPLMMLYGAQAGYPVNSIIRPARDSALEEFLYKKRTELGVNTIYAIPRKECVLRCLKALRDNEVLFVPLDQNFGSNGGVFVDFFGQKAATATGPVVFAKRTGAAILPMFIIRQNDDTHKIVIEPPLALEEKENEDATVVHNIARITKIIEKYIRQYPHEWGWMHRRWKSRPSKTSHAKRSK